MSRRSVRRDAYWALSLLLLAAVLAVLLLLRISGNRGAAPHALPAQEATPYDDLQPAPQAAPEPAPPVDVAVVRVIDGDTIVVTGKRRIRLIGVDTPETVHPDRPVEPWGPEASAFTREFLADGQVRLEFDVERKDKYGRWLAYVWVDDRMLNEELVRAGLARAKLGYPYAEAMKVRFRRAEQEAQTAHRGIWSAAPATRASD